MGVCWNWRSNRFYIDTAVLDNMDLPPPRTPTHTIKHILYWCTNVLNSHLLSFYVSNCTCSSTICWYFLLACTCTEAPKQPSVDFSVGKYMYWTVICCYSLLASIGTQQLPVVILCWHVQVLSSHLLIFCWQAHSTKQPHVDTLCWQVVCTCTKALEWPPADILCWQVHTQTPKGALCYVTWSTKRGHLLVFCWQVHVLNHQSSVDLLCWQVV